MLLEVIAHRVLSSQRRWAIGLTSLLSLLHSPRPSPWAVLTLQTCPAGMRTGA